MFERMNQEAFACVPRHLVDKLIEAKGACDWPEQQRLSNEIAEAAIDDIT
ncbi:hypothetical protein LCM27_01975 [Ruegeria marisrubri]|nr:hypothetical protein [Ruegeria marisrubri]MCA0905160.1 hypothetical protein [Ruegeria marisrubri]